jgi:HEAT repeat protein
MKREHPSDEQLRVQALERYFAAMRARDWEGLAACLSPGLRRSGPYRDVIEGVRPYLEYLSKVLASLSNHALEVARIRTLGDRSARGAVEAALADPDPGLRKTAAFALGEIGDPAAVGPLVQALDDAMADVRFNAALSLARLGSDAGVPVLETMVDRRLLSAVPDITREQQEQIMVSGLAALAAVGSAEHLATVDRLAAADPSLRVRQAAIEARKALRAGA